MHDNLVAMAREDAGLLPLPGYATVCRFMKHHGLGKQRKPRRHELEDGFVARERRSYEVTHVHSLWHCDFHDAKRKVISASGERIEATLFGVLDDRSRLCCHAQWYLGDENGESFVHGLFQAFQKRGLPRSLLSDNGGAMNNAEVEEGLGRLSVLHPTTLSETPEQNGEQEVFWSQVEGRLMAMLEGEKNLTLELDSRQLLCVILAGDSRLVERLRTPELLPLRSHIRRRLPLEYATRDELLACLEHLLEVAGNPSLMTSELKATLADHAAGNYRVLTNLAGVLLSVAMDRDLTRLDEKLYLEVFQQAARAKPSAKRK